MSENKILLHSCCAICSGYPITYLQDAGYEVVVFFYNSNIYPIEEYQKRLSAQKILCNKFNCELIEGKYDTESFYQIGLKDEPEGGLRCLKCFELRLEESFKKAKELGIDEITTSLPISPHKDFEKISAIGEQLSQKYGIKYLAINFKKKDGFLKTNKIAKDLELYRQNYCGCLYSKGVNA